jgi:hypothetical protein
MREILYESPDTRINVRLHFYERKKVFFALKNFFFRKDV